MTRPHINVITAAQNASQRLADRHTPFVMNDWYVAAFGEEVKDQLLARTLLGRRLVFYLASDGLLRLSVGIEATADLAADIAAALKRAERAQAA